jgi:microcystin-dependent protein
MISNTTNFSSYRKNINNHEETLNRHQDFIDNYEQVLNGLFDKIYPVGCLYWSSNPTNPSQLFGGTWTQITGKFIYAADTNHSVNTTGGEEVHTLTVNETPAHTHTRGTMNITGGTGMHVTRNGANAGEGAFYWGNHTCGGLTGNAQSYGQMFDASRTWTGATSSVGGSAAHNNMPPYLVKYCWERTA